MTPARLTECLQALNWSMRGLAKLLNRSEATIRQWQAGKVRIPPETATWLERLASYHRRNPPPT